MSAISASIHEGFEQARADGTTEYLVVSARRILEGLRRIDLRAFEGRATPETAVTVSRQIVPALLQHAGAAARLLGSIPEMVGARRQSAPEITDVELDFGSDPVPQGSAEGDIEAALAQLCAPQSAPQTDIEGTCAMLAFELRGMQARLKQARWQQSLWGMLSECDELRNKAQRAATLALTVLEEVEGTTSNSDNDDELEAALAQRQVLLTFRDEIVTLTSGREALPPAEARQRLVACHARLSALTRQPVFSGIKGSERLAVRQLEQRVEEVLGASTNPAAGRELLADLGAFAELLGEINRSEPLVRHDRALRTRCLDQLRAISCTAPLLGVRAWEHAAGALQETVGLRFRDPQLAARVTAHLHNPPSEAATIVAVLEDVVTDLEALRV